MKITGKYQKIYTNTEYFVMKLLNQSNDYVWNKENNKHKNRGRDDFGL